MHPELGTRSSWRPSLRLIASLYDVYYLNQAKPVPYRSTRADRALTKRDMHARQISRESPQSNFREAPSLSAQKKSRPSALYEECLDDYDTHQRTIPMPATRKKQHRVWNQQAGLSKAAIAYAKKVSSNRRLAIKFLKEAGIIEKPGVLARPYR